jgi:hypothetical protein
VGEKTTATLAEPYLWNRSHINVALNYDFLKTLQRFGLWK